MGFFSTFWSWLNLQLTDYIGDSTARLAAALEPAVVTVAVLYVMAWGYLQLTGRIEEPVLTGLRRIGLLGLVLGAASRLWLYNSVIVDTFYQAPTELAAAMVGSSDPVATVDTIWSQGGAVAEQLWDHTGWNFGFEVMALVVWLFVGLLCVYTMFLIALASIASSILLAIGPLFIVLLLFERTQRFFDSWIAQLANYALITILTVLVGTLLLRIVQSYATQTAARGAALLTMDALDMVLICGLALLLLRQVMPIAAGLATGVALSSLGTFSSTLRWHGRQLRQGAWQGSVIAAKAISNQLTQPSASSFTTMATDSQVRDAT